MGACLVANGLATIVILQKENDKPSIQIPKKKHHIHNLHKPEKNQNQDGFIAKQADDLIVFRQLKGKTSFNDIDLSDEEINDAGINTGMTDVATEEFTAKLKKIIQLTGYSVFFLTLSLIM